MAKEENKLEAAYLRFARTKSEFGTDHIEGAARPEELLQEKKGEKEHSENSENEHHENSSSSSSSSNEVARLKDLAEQLDLKRAAKSMILCWFLNLAGAWLNTWIYNFMHKATKIKHKDIMLEDSEMDQAMSFFNAGDSKLMSFMDKIPDAVWGFLSFQYFFLEKISEAPKTIVVIEKKDANESGK
jgi:hypothetical protein